MRGAKGQLRRPVPGKTGHPPGFGAFCDARIGARGADRGQKGGKWAFSGRFVSLDGFPDGFVSERWVEKQRMPVRALKRQGLEGMPVASIQMWKNKECP